MMHFLFSEKNMKTPHVIYISAQIYLSLEEI